MAALAKPAPPQNVRRCKCEQMLRQQSAKTSGWKVRLAPVQARRSEWQPFSDQPFVDGAAKVS